MDIPGQNLEGNLLFFLRNFPKIVSAFIHGNGVSIDVPRPQGDACRAGGRSQMLFVPHRHSQVVWRHSARYFLCSRHAMAKILIQQPECMALLISAAYVSKQNAATVGFHDFLHIEGTPAPAKTCYSGKSQEALPLNDPEAQADLQNRIRQRAHRLWEAEGSPARRRRILAPSAGTHRRRVTVGLSAGAVQRQPDLEDGLAAPECATAVVCFSPAPSCAQTARHFAFAKPHPPATCSP